MPSRPTSIKAAELLSGLGAIVVGTGLGLLAPVFMRRGALPVLIAGIVVHGTGMTLKYRLGNPARHAALVGTGAVLGVLAGPRWPHRWGGMAMVELKQRRDR